MPFDASRGFSQFVARGTLTIELEREDDGRWIAEALELPGVMSYGSTRDEAISKTERMAIAVIADRVAHGELPATAFNVSFQIPDEQMGGN
ncbi:MAG: type II toxin-antitoxin system HicB family antitoxin [Bryobacteraceae bacterium]